MTDVFDAVVARVPDAVALRYFDGTLTFRELDTAADALAVELVERGFGAGERLAVYVQNNPAFVIGLVAAWKAGGIAVAVNPMNKARELTYLLADSGASALLCLDELYDPVVRPVVEGGATRLSTVITCSALDWQRRNDPRLFPAPVRVVCPGGTDLLDVIRRRSGERPPRRTPQPGDVAVLTYTSGTTGKPKGAMNTHSGLAFNGQTFRDWIGLGAGDRVLGIAPLFHITGLVGHLCLSLLLGCPLVLTHRFHPGVMLDAIREHEPTFTIGAITAFIALAGAEGIAKEDFASLSRIYSGGAPIPPAVNARLEELTGRYIHNSYGLTETSSATHFVPFGCRAPVDPVSGALSIGVPVFGTVARVVDDDGREVPVGETGEVVLSGPQVVPGYWRNPAATAESIGAHGLRTGDVGFMDSDGWFYLVDRKKDMINAAGYKVWPREVEDVLYGHPAVREAAVVGTADEYRGETVVAFVSLKPDARADAGQLVSFCKEQLAAYKYPRSITILDDLPKTITGKILRRELRERAAGSKRPDAG